LRGVGGVLTVVAVIQTADHILDAVEADIDQGTGGTQTARTVAVEGGGWAGACVGAEAGAEMGLMCGEFAPICSPVGGLIMGGVGYHYGAGAVQDAIDYGPNAARDAYITMDRGIWDLYGMGQYR